MSESTLIVAGAVAALLLLLGGKVGAQPAPPPAPPPVPRPLSPPAPPAPPAGSAHGAARAASDGPVNFSIEVISPAIRITTTAKNELTVDATGCKVRIDEDGDEVEVEVDEAVPGGCTRIDVTLPAGSSVEVNSVSGDVILKGTYRNVEIEAVSGAVEVERAVEVEIDAVSGGVTVGDVTARAEIESVSGPVRVGSSGVAPRLELSSVSGPIAWTGACGKGCRLEVDAHSAPVTLTFVAAKSAFDLAFDTMTGRFADGLGLRAPKPGSKATRKGSFGAKPEGAVRVDTYSGTLDLKKQ